MSKAGMNNYKGVNYQAWAAMLLFLLRINDGGFESMTIEDEEWEDFTLTYSDGKKIVCEAKFRSSPLTPALLKNILQNIADSPASLNKTDEVLIICPQVSTELEDNVRYVDWSSEIKQWFKKKGFSNKLIKLLPQVSFFKAADKQYLYNETLSYFYNHDKIGYAWLPTTEVEQWLKSVLIDHVYDKAVQGGTFTRAQLSLLIDKYFEEKINLNGSYDSEQKAVREQYKSLLSDIKAENITSLRSNMSVLSAQPHLMQIVLNIIFAQPNIDLKKWDILWSSLIDRQYWFTIVNEFRSRMDSIENAKYALELFTDHIDAFTNPAFDSFRAEYAIQNILEILKKHPTLSGNALTFIQKYLETKRISYHDLDGSNHRQEKYEIASLLTYIYSRGPNSSQVKKSILDLASKHFDLVSDDGEFDMYTPSEIYKIFYKYLIEDFRSNFEYIKDLLVNQFADAKFYGKKFNGWELMGGSFSQSGDEFSLADRHFLKFIIKPALRSYYESSPEEAWQMILDEFVSRTEDDVTRLKPDFLNRAAIPILLSEYGKSGEYSELAFEILNDLMLMTKGIPSKFEVIFQELRNRQDISNGAKWKLTKEFLKKYPVPLSVFIEQIVSDLAIQGHDEALSTVTSWIENPQYRKRQQQHSFFVGQSMFKLLDTESTSHSFSAGVDILRYYLTTDEFKTELDTFDAYSVARTITKVIEQNAQTGFDILRDLYRSSGQLTNNQQVAIWLSIEQINKQNKDLLVFAYTGFIEDVIFSDLKADNILIEAKFPHHYARELIVQYGVNIASLGLMSEAIRLVRIFIKDTHPTLSNDENDPDGTFNYHQRILNGEDPHTINTVRGWVAWILVKFVAVRGKDYIDEIIGFVEMLAFDENLYVRTQATIPLAALAQNRHTVLPNTDTRFITPKQAMRIENIAFKMLRENSNSPVILKHLEAVFHRMRAISEDRAKEIFKTYGVVGYKPKTENIYVLLAYFALFRKDDFKAEGLKRLLGESLYQSLNNYDDSFFKQLLVNSIRKGDDNIRRHIAWYFWTLPRKNAGDFEGIFDISYEYLKVVAERYTREAFNSIDHFIHDHLDVKPTECLSLWKNVTRRERDWLIQNHKSMQRHEWWSHHYNAEFLVKIRELEGDEQYLDMIEIILGYPEGFLPMMNPNDIYEGLKEIGTKRTQELLEKLLDAFPVLHEKETD